MKKIKITQFSIIALSIIILVAISCTKEAGHTSKNPFDSTYGDVNQIRNKIVVISDLHLGADLTYSECLNHLPRLEEFLNEIRESKTVKELVIAGDLFDEWYIPSRTDTYGGDTQEEFIKKIATSNKDVFDVLKAMIKEGKVKVSYTPGNHDLTVPEEYVSDVLPGINQARDAGKMGLGTYYPDNYPQIAIEHGHRYDFFCAPDPYSNQDIAPGTILPAGYFFSRIAVNSILYPPSAGEATPVPNVTLNSSDETQKNCFTYYSVWKNVLEGLIPVKDNFDEKTIVTNLDHFTGSYSINEVLPHNTDNGSIDMDLYSGSCNQAAWEKRLLYNNVPVMTPLKDAIPGSVLTAFIDKQSNTQYFQNTKSDVRVVVFGHTHIPMILSYTNADNKGCVYVNSGTWIDKVARNGKTVDQDVENMDFVVITPQLSDNSVLKVERFKYWKGEHLSLESKSIIL